MGDLFKNIVLTNISWYENEVVFALINRYKRGERWKRPTQL